MPAAADPDLAQRLAKEVLEAYAEATARLLRLVAERLARGIDEPGWAERKLVEQHQLREQARRIVERLDVFGPDAVERAIASAYEAGQTAGAAELAATGEQVTAAFGTTNQRAVEALAREAVGALRATGPAILRDIDDTYRQVVSRTAQQTVTGTATRRQAAQAALDEWAQRGIRSFPDRAGRMWRIESYAEMATRTAVGQAQVQGTLDQYEDAGRDLVIISDAPQECSLCRPHEGKVYSISGATPGYRTLAWARSEGLWHPQCRHRAGPYVEGLTRRMQHTADPEGDALRQEQRRLERGVREWKRREAVAIDPAARKAAAAKVREWQGRLKAHVDDNDLKRLRSREQIGSAT